MLSFLSRLTWAFFPTGLLTLILIAGGLRAVKYVLLARVDNFLLEHALFLHRDVVDNGLGWWQMGLVSALAIIRDLFLLYLLASAWLVDVVT